MSTVTRNITFVFLPSSFLGLKTFASVNINCWYIGHNKTLSMNIDMHLGSINRFLSIPQGTVSCCYEQKICTKLPGFVAHGNSPYVNRTLSTNKMMTYTRAFWFGPHELMAITTLSVSCLAVLRYERKLAFFVWNGNNC